MAWVASATVGLRSVARRTASWKVTRPGTVSVWADAGMAARRTARPTTADRKCSNMGRSRGGRRRRFVVAVMAHLARGQGADHDVEHRDEEDGKEGRGEHAARHRRPHGV